MSTTEPRYNLPPLTLAQLDEMKAALEVASANEADPDADIFSLLDLVRRARTEAIRSRQRDQESGEANPIRRASLIEVEAAQRASEGQHG